MRVLGCTLLILGLIGSGCTGTDDIARGPHQDRAEGVLGEETFYVAPMGIEFAVPPVAPELEPCGDFVEDEAHGDGEPSLWAHLYSNGQPGPLGLVYVITDPDGSFRCTLANLKFLKEAFPAPQVVGPAGPLRLDAADAADRLVSQLPGFRETVEHCPTTFGVFGGEGGPYWLFTAYDLNEEAPAQWAVDASDGRILLDKPQVGPFAPPCIPESESGSVQGSFTGSAATASVEAATFELDQSHVQLTIRVNSQDPAAEMGMSYRVEITYPDGTSLGGMVTNDQQIEPGPGLRGAYEVHAYPASAGAYSFTVDYCAHQGPACGEGDEGT